MRVFPFFLLSCCATPALAQEASIMPVDFDLAQVERPAGPSERSIPAEPAPDRVGVNVDVTVASGRIFQDQRFVLSTDPVTEVSINFSYDGWDLGVWRAESLVGNRDDRETDFTLSRQIAGSEQFNVRGQVGLYFIPDTPLIYEAKLSFAYEIGGGFEAEVSAEIMRGGFDDEVLRGQLGWSREVAPRVTLDATASLSLSSFGGGASFGYEAGASYQLDQHLALRAYVSGFASSVGSGRVFGLSLSWTP